MTSVRWKTVSSDAPARGGSWKKSPAEEGGKSWLDWVSEDGNWKAAEGYDEEARRDGRPWSLFHRVDGRWRWTGTHKSLADAKSRARELAGGSA